MKIKQQKPTLLQKFLWAFGASTVIFTVLILTIFPSSLPNSMMMKTLIGGILASIITGVIAIIIPIKSKVGYVFISISITLLAAMWIGKDQDLYKQHYSAERKQNIEKYKNNKNYDSDMNYLAELAIAEDREGFKRLVQEKKLLNVADTDGDTPLHVASITDLSLTKWLINEGAHKDKKNATGWTPLLAAAAFGYPETVQLLLEQGSDPKVVSIANQNAVTLAYVGMKLKKKQPTNKSGKHKEAVDLLLKSGINVNNVSSRGFTPLVFAVLSDDIQFAKKFIAYGANINHKLDNGRTIKDLARKTENLSMLKLF